MSCSSSTTSTRVSAGGEGPADPADLSGNVMPSRSSSLRRDVLIIGFREEQVQAIHGSAGRFPGCDERPVHCLTVDRPVYTTVPSSTTPSFGDDHDAVADVVAVAVGVLHAGFVHQADVLADAGILVDDDPVEHHVAPDADGGTGVRGALFSVS